MKLLLPIAASLSLALAAFAVTAQDAAAPAAPATDAQAAPAADAAPGELKGDPVRGKGLVYTCKGCHGIPGYKNAYPSYHVPKIGGQSATYLSAALNEYRSGNRKHPTMQAQAQSFSEQDIADIAAYLSSIK